MEFIRIGTSVDLGGFSSGMPAAATLVEQNIAFARRASQRFAILNRGSVAVSGPIGQLSDEMIHQHLVV